MQKNYLNMHSFHIHYSPDYMQSFGFKIKSYSELADNSAMLTYNRLLFRDNGDGYQANIFLRSGFGSFINSADVSVLGSVSMDFETRRFYSAIEAQRIGKIYENNFWLYSGTIGVLPLLAPVDKLNTWVLLRYDYKLYDNGHVFTPIVRFMYSDKMVEIGYNYEEEWSKVFFTWEVIF
jgi:hypothetical protein